MKHKRFHIVTILLCASLTTGAVLPRQDEEPLFNFTLNENDTTRYDNHYLYEKAYRTIEDMLTDKRPTDLKMANFHVDNCYFDGKNDSAVYVQEIKIIVKALKQMYDMHRPMAPSDNVARNYCIYSYFTEASHFNQYHTYQYDIRSMEQTKTVLEYGTVSHLLRTRMGTCTSLPMLYKILADETGAEAYIALAPMHSYIRHQDHTGEWWNFETTTGTFSRSSFIMENFHVTENAIRSGMYMTNLTEKETLVQCLYMLLCIYEFKTGFYSNAFVQKCYRLGLNYHYADAMHIWEINDLKYQLDKDAWNNGYQNHQEMCTSDQYRKQFEFITQKRKELEQLGFYAFTTEDYLKQYKAAMKYYKKQPETAKKE